MLTAGTEVARERVRGGGGGGGGGVGFGVVAVEGETEGAGELGEGELGGDARADSRSI